MCWCSKIQGMKVVARLSRGLIFTITVRDSVAPPGSRVNVARVGTTPHQSSWPPGPYLIVVQGCASSSCRPLAIELDETQVGRLQRDAQRGFELGGDDAAAHGYFFVPSSIALISTGQYSCSKPSSRARSISSRATSAPSAGTPCSSAIWMA